jgi:hypothetical protein
MFCLDASEQLELRTARRGRELLDGEDWGKEERGL